MRGPTVRSVGVPRAHGRRRALAAALIVTASLAAASDAQAVSDAEAQAAAAAVTQAAVVPAGWTGVTWTGNDQTCAPGSESSASRDATLLAVNQFRLVAGLPPVAFDAALNAKALAAATMMLAGNQHGLNYKLSHEPLNPSDKNYHPDWPCQNIPGALDGAFNSNLALGSSGASAIRAYVDDDGVGGLGHRRWVLDPAATVFGSGSTGQTNALTVIGGPTVPVASGTQVPWPPAGAIAASWLPEAWSISVGGTGDTVTIAAPQVSMTLDGAPVAVAPESVSDDGAGYGTGRALSWTPSLTTTGLRSGYHQIAVSISGFTVNGVAVPINYTTTLGTLPTATPTPTPATTPTINAPASKTLPNLMPRIIHPRGSVKPGMRLSASFAQGTGRIVTGFRWLRSGKAIKRATAVRYKVTRADRGRTLRVQITSQAKDGSQKKTELSTGVKVRKR